MRAGERDEVVDLDHLDHLEHLDLRVHNLTLDL